MPFPAAASTCAHGPICIFPVFSASRPSPTEDASCRYPLASRGRKRVDQRVGPTAIGSTTSLFNANARACAGPLIPKIQFSGFGGSLTYISLHPNAAVMWYGATAESVRCIAWGPKAMSGISSSTVISSRRHETASMPSVAWRSLNSYPTPWKSKAGICRQGGVPAIVARVIGQLVSVDFGNIRYS